MHQVFCLDHRSCKAHECPKPDHNSRKVVVCETCSTSIEITGHHGEEEKLILERHEKSGECDPKKKKKPTCPVKRCREILTFSNTSTCKTCQIKVCLKHRFPADHACKRNSSSSSSENKFLIALASRIGNDCGKKGRSSKSPTSSPSVKAY